MIALPYLATRVPILNMQTPLPLPPSLPSPIKRPRHVLHTYIHTYATYSVLSTTGSADYKKLGILQILNYIWGAKAGRGR